MASQSPANPPMSGLQQFILTNSLPKNSPHASGTHKLALQVAHNLRFQHGWTDIRMNYYPTSQAPAKTLPRPVISGLPPQRLYTHPDEQIELLQRQRDQGKAGLPDVTPEREWVLSSQLQEPWTLRRFAEVFDALAESPPDGESGALEFVGSGNSADAEGITENDGLASGLRSATGSATVDGESSSRNPWRTGQPKRLLLATLDDDSTVVYYIVHDGIVKPRQN